MIHLDTSALIDALTGRRNSLPALARAIEVGERVTFSTVVLYEWLRGPRNQSELAMQEEMFPIAQLVLFDAETARHSATLYRAVSRGRGREADLSIAAAAIREKAHLWTLNVDDFSDVPGLSLWLPK